MKLYLLRPVKNLKDDDNPWEPWYDKSFGFVVRAVDEEEARAISHGNAGDENRGEFGGKKISKTKNPWLDKNYSTCVELTRSGQKGVIIEDFAMAY